MGYLSGIGNAVGQGVATAEGATNAVGMANAGMGAGTLGTGLTAGGQVLSGLGQAQQFLFRAQVASHNAAAMRANANAEREAGAYGESVAKLRTGERVASQRAAFAANGVDVNTGSAADVQASTAKVGALDAAMIHYNASRAAYGDEVSAQNFKSQAALDRSGAVGSAIGGLARGGISAIGGAQALSSKWQTWRKVAGGQA